MEAAEQRVDVQFGPERGVNMMVKAQIGKGEAREVSGGCPREAL